MRDLGRKVGVDLDYKVFSALELFPRPVGPRYNQRFVVRDLSKIHQDRRPIGQHQI
jgi:hypothetical protein